MSNNKNTVCCMVAEYPLVQQSAVHGLMELFDTANRLAPPDTPKLEMSTCLLSSRTLRHKTHYGVVILPPCLSQSPPSTLDSTPSLDWLKRCHRNGALICSVCSGSFLLAETGLLDGRSATTHWLYEAAFRYKFPQVELQFDRLIDHHQDVITAGGLMAWTDLGLHLIQRFHGTQTMLDVSSLFLIEPGLRQQKFYASYIPKRDHGDEKILITQNLIEEKLANRWSIAILAQRVELTERTFLRRFKRSTGINPTHYLQQIRVAGARKELESSTQPIEQVAWQVGYTDAPAFSRTFKQIVGLSPGAYRKRFSINAPAPDFSTC